MRYDVIGSISDFESERLGSNPGISAYTPLVKLVDTPDSRSGTILWYAGSTPAWGTRKTVSYGFSSDVAG